MSHFLVDENSPNINISNNKSNNVNSYCSIRSVLKDSSNLSVRKSDHSANSISNVCKSNENQESDEKSFLKRGLSPILTPIFSLQQDTSANDEEENEEERIRREEKESELLAWELMKEESNELYQLQLQFMQENEATLSADDYNAMQLAMQESGIVVANNDDNTGDNDLNNNLNDVSDELDYDELINLGQAIGGVFFK
jgi:hypothetical protein